MPRAVPLLFVAPLCVAALSLCGCGASTPEVVDANPGNAERLRLRFEPKAGGAGENARGPWDDRVGARWATIKGTITITGSPPGEQFVSIPGDKVSECRQGGTSVPIGSLVVGSGGGIENFIIYLDTKFPKDDSDQGDQAVYVHPDYVITPDETPFLDQHKCMFDFRVLAFRSQQTIQIRNGDTVGHNINLGAAKRAEKINISIDKGDYIEYVAVREETRPFQASCSIHPWMGMHLLPRDNPYFQVTKDDGAYEIANLPAEGPLEFRLWHERAGNLGPGNVTLSGEGSEAFAWSRGKLAVNLEPGKTYMLNLEIDASAFK